MDHSRTTSAASLLRFRPSQKTTGAVWHGSTFKLIHLPSQGKILDLEMQHTAKHAAEQFAVLDVNWWTCIPEEVIGPDLQEMRNLWARLTGRTWVPWPNVKALKE